MFEYRCIPVSLGALHIHETVAVTYQCHRHSLACRCLDNPPVHESLHEVRRYRESISSFAALAAQTSSLSQSQSALFERDQPQMSIGGASEDGIIFRQLDDATLNSMREKLKVRKWEEAKADGS